MSPPIFDSSQALRQALSDALDVTLDDHNVNLPRNLPSFASRNTGGTFNSPFLSLPQPPPFQLGYARPFSYNAMPRSVSYPAAWKNSDEIFLTAVEAERRRLREVHATLLGKQQMLIHNAQNRQLDLLLNRQKRQDSFLSFPQSTLPMQNMAALPPHVTVPTTSAELLPAPCLADADADSIKILKLLGSSLRGKSDPYIEVSRITVDRGQELQTIRGGVIYPFPQKLYRMLEEAEEQGKAHIVSFYPHGRSFGIRDMKAFTDEILPKYFSKQSKMVSFLRQLNLYGFVRIHSGPDLGGYYHELFLKGRPELSSFMRRTGASKGDEDRRKRKDRHLPTIQPDFYAMQPIRLSQEHEKF
jgi:hypothetical protein